MATATPGVTTANAPDTHRTATIHQGEQPQWYMAVGKKRLTQNQDKESDSMWAPEQAH